MLNVTSQNLKKYPFPHGVVENILPNDLFQRLKEEYPSEAVIRSAPQRYNMQTRYFLDSYYTEFFDFLKGSSAWNEFYHYLNSKAFKQLNLELFQTYLEEFECSLRLNYCYFDSKYNKLSQSYLNKIRIIKRLRAKLRFLQRDVLFTELSISMAVPGYEREAHRDNLQRLATFLIYFSDIDEEDSSSGALQLHDVLKKMPYRSYPKQAEAGTTQVFQTIVPRENCGVAFLCSNNSYHSVSPLLNGKRKFIYFSLTCKRKIWHMEP